MRPWLACTESKHRVKGLTSNENVQGFTCTESKHRVKGLTSHETL